MGFDIYWKELSCGRTYDDPNESAKDVWEDFQYLLQLKESEVLKLKGVMCEVLELIRKDQREYGESENLLFAINNLRHALEI